MAGATDGDVDRALAAMGASVPLKYHSFGVITVRPAGAPPPPQAAAGQSGAAAAGFATEYAQPGASPHAAAAVFALLGKALPEAFQVEVEPQWAVGAPVAMHNGGEIFTAPPAKAAAPSAPSPALHADTAPPPASQPESYSPFTLPPWLEPIPAAPPVAAARFDPFLSGPSGAQPGAHPGVQPAPAVSPAPPHLDPFREPSSNFAIPSWLEIPPTPPVPPALDAAEVPPPFAESDRTIVMPGVLPGRAAGSDGFGQPPSAFPAWLDAVPPTRQHGFASLESEQQSFAAPLPPHEPAPSYPPPGQPMPFADPYAAPLPRQEPPRPATPNPAMPNPAMPYPAMPVTHPAGSGWPPPETFAPHPVEPPAWQTASFEAAPLPVPREEPPMFREPPMVQEVPHEVVPHEVVPGDVPLRQAHETFQVQPEVTPIFRATEAPFEAPLSVLQQPPFQTGSQPAAAAPAGRKPLSDMFRTLGSRPLPPRDTSF